MPIQSRADAYRKCKKHRHELVRPEEHHLIAHGYLAPEGLQCNMRGALRDLSATGDWIPRHLGPFDARNAGHTELP